MSNDSLITLLENAAIVHAEPSMPCVPLDVAIDIAKAHLAGDAAIRKDADRESAEACTTSPASSAMGAPERKQVCESVGAIPAAPATPDTLIGKPKAIRAWESYKQTWTDPTYSDDERSCFIAGWNAGVAQSSEIPGNECPENITANQLKAMRDSIYHGSGISQYSQLLLITQIEHYMKAREPKREVVKQDYGELEDIFRVRDGQNPYCPRIIDLCYTSFMRAKGKNSEDGGPTDWMTDTEPHIREMIAKLRERVFNSIEDGSANGR